MATGLIDIRGGGNGRMILSKSQGEQEIKGGNNGCVVRHVIWG